MSSPWDKMLNKDSLPIEVAEAIERWERRAGSSARIYRWGMEVSDSAFADVENLQITSRHVESSREKQKEQYQLRNEEIVVWVGQTIKEIKRLQEHHAAAEMASEKRLLEKVLLSHYNAKPNDVPREVAFSEAHLLWSVAEKTIMNIFDSPDFREARDRAQPFSPLIID